MKRLLLLPCFALALAAPIPAAEPLLEGLGTYHLPISTKNPTAQRYFDQGMVMAWGFNHPAAERAFRAAAELDPSCALCFWGSAWVLGPNINASMAEEDAPKAWQDVRTAESLAKGAQAWERALIAALSARYAEEAPEDREELDLAYAAALRQVVKKYPKVNEARVLLADALMNLHPWDYWQEDGEKQPWTPEILELLSQAMAADAAHPGANHLYIHAVEASKTPDLGLEAADRLAALVPAAGHLVHMPSHIYQRVGRYEDSARANEAAIQADRALPSPDCHSDYQASYGLHNIHFLWGARLMAGNAAAALAAADELGSKIELERMRDLDRGSFQQHFSLTRTFALVRFGRWAEVLSLPEPPEDLIYPRAIRSWARGLAALRTQDLGLARFEYTRLLELAADPLLAKIWESNSPEKLVAIAVQLLAGELALAERVNDKAIRHFEKAVSLDDALRYDEPPTWPVATRHFLGAAQLEIGRFSDAEKTFRDDLERQRENGWALRGLLEALQRQDKSAAAEETQARFTKAWAHADTEISTSRF